MLRKRKPANLRTYVYPIGTAFGPYIICDSEPWSWLTLYSGFSRAVLICCKLARISIEEEKLEVQQDPALHTEEKVIVDKQNSGTQNM